MSSKRSGTLVNADGGVITCMLCNINPSKYCCPRCRILYCSMECYKSKEHVICSEVFYKECIAEEMACNEPDPDSKHKMMEILNKMYGRAQADNGAEFKDMNGMLEMLDEKFGNTPFSQSDQNIPDDYEDDDSRDSDDGDSIPDLGDRLKGIDLEDSESVWKMLTEDEKIEFESTVASGNWRGEILVSWSPWWNYHKEKKLIEEITDSKLVKTEYDYKSKCPGLLKNVKAFSHISKHTPAPCVKYNLLNVLCSYVYTVRLFNGDHHAFGLEAAAVMFGICGNIKYGVNFDYIGAVIDSIVQECNNNAFISFDNEALQVMKEDVMNLVKGPEESNRIFYITCALSDIHQLLNGAKRTAKIKEDKTESDDINEFAKRFPDYQATEVPSVQKQAIKSAVMKIEYFLSFSKDFGSQLIDVSNEYISIIK